MPQMMPLNWFMLLVYVSLILVMLMVILNYMLYYKNSTKIEFLKKKIKFNWMW